MESWKVAIVIVILILTLCNFIRFGLGMKDGILQAQGMRVMLDNDVDVVVSSLGLLLVGLGLGAVGTYASFGRELAELPKKLTGSQSQ